VFFGALKAWVSPSQALLEGEVYQLRQEFVVWIALSSEVFCSLAVMPSSATYFVGWLGLIPMDYV